MPFENEPFQPLLEALESKAQALQNLLDKSTQGEAPLQEPFRWVADGEGGLVKVNLNQTGGLTALAASSLDIVRTSEVMILRDRKKLLEACDLLRRAYPQLQGIDEFGIPQGELLKDIDDFLMNREKA